MNSLDMVAQLQDVKVINTSGIYETEPVEFVDQPLFLNMAAHISTPMTSLNLLRKLKQIETMIGRKPRERWREREIDIDIIFYGNEIIESEELTIPHPRAHLRRFVLQPMNEIAAHYVHPVFSKTVAQLLSECRDESRVTLISGPTRPAD